MQFISNICTLKYIFEKLEIISQIVSMTLSFYSFKRSGNIIIIIQQRIEHIPIRKSKNIGLFRPSIGIPIIFIINRAEKGNGKGKL